MNLMPSFMRKNFLFKDKNVVLLIVILVAAFLIRTVYLNQVPPGIANDEINIIINAQSFLKTGENIPGVVTGIFGTPKGDLNGGIHSEVSSYLLMPFIALTGFVWPWVKLPFVFAGLGIVTLSFLIVRKLINTNAAMIASVVSALSPWTIFYGRSGYESILSSFFYLLGIYLVLSLKKWRILYAFPIFLLGMGSYFSAKTLMLPIIIVAVISVMLLKPKESKIPGVSLIIIAVLFMALYLPILKNTPAGSRFDELSNTKIVDLVNIKRTAALEQPAANLYENKIAEDLKYRIKASFGGFSLSYLFLDGQPENIPSLAIPDHAFLYLIDLPFILLGCFFLAKFYPKVLFLIGGLLTTTLIPNSLNLQGTTYSIRTVILFPVLSMVSAIGIYYVISLFKNSSWRYGTGLFISLIYLIFVGNFIFQYFGRLPVDRNEGWFLPQRTAFRYATLMNNQSPATVVNIISQETKPDFYRYLLFSASYTEKSKIANINQQIENQDYSANNVRITGNCPDLFDPNQIYLIDGRIDCTSEKVREIASIKDAGTKFRIVNDQLCKNSDSQKYPFVKDINKLNVESLSVDDFCQTFVTFNR